MSREQLGPEYPKDKGFGLKPPASDHLSFWGPREVLTCTAKMLQNQLGCPAIEEASQLGVAETTLARKSWLQGLVSALLSCSSVTPDRQLPLCGSQFPYLDNEEPRPDDLEGPISFQVSVISRKRRHHIPW